MFATPIISRDAYKIAGRRAISSTVKAASAVVPKQYAPNFTRHYLSDPATYPLVVIMTVAMTVCVGMSMNALTRYKGIKVRTEHKHSEVISWPEASVPYQSITEFITRRPIGFHSEGFKSLRHEGLGVDHEQWKKSKEASKKA
ncbi:hypothetical protein ACA910_008922 [Epithemia clementina (nom. ined.)]